MRLLIVLVSALCFSLTADGKGLSSETELSNDTAELLNQLEEDYDPEMESPSVLLSLVPEQFIEDQFVESSGVSPCSDEPCLNEGNCTVLAEDSYVCQCPEGYYGKNCEEANLCYENPCRNGGKCKSRSGRSYFCECAEGFQGKHCEEDVDECSVSADICDENAICKNIQGSYTCTCKDGYSGDGNTCNDIDECEIANPCMNGASCFNTPGSYRCACQHGHDGTNCENDINECQAKKPCQNGATCENFPGSYGCTCKAGFTGKHCQTDIDECLPSSNPCLNGSRCSNSPGTYRCTCKPRFNGRNCENDIDECAVKNGECSHDCSNTVGSYTCSCPDAELSLADNKHSCEAIGVVVKCLQNEMSITIPKSILKGMDREHIRLLDPKCGATETPTHFNLKTPLTGCNTTRRHTKSAIVYSNKVLEIPLKKNDVITRVREIEIPFSCYYSNSRVATAVGVKPENRKLIFSKKGKGNFTVILELFHSNSFATSYGADNFPLSLKLRQYMYFQAKVQSKDNRLSIMTEKCFATPTPQQSNPIKHAILDNGCAIDDTVEFYPSPIGTFRFGLEAFEFLNQTFVFVHCHVLICNASDAQSRCARGCEKNNRHRREVGHRTLYSLAQGPITLDYNNEYQEQDNTLAADNQMHTAPGMNVPLVAAVAVMTALTMFGVAFTAFRNRSRNSGYLLLKK